MGKEKENIEKLAIEIKDFLNLHELDFDIAIYFNSKILDKMGKKDWELIENVLPSTFTKYANDETITLIFEGPFYGMINFSWTNLEYRNEIDNKFRETLNKYGYYYEIGEAWNIALYKFGKTHCVTIKK